MFVRVKGKEPNRYLQIVENRREGKRTLQRVVATLKKQGKCCHKTLPYKEISLQLILRFVYV